MQKENKKVKSSFRYIDNKITEISMEKRCIDALIAKSSKFLQSKMSFQTVSDLKRVTNEMTNLVKNQKHKLDKQTSGKHSPYFDLSFQMTISSNSQWGNNLPWCVSLNPKLQI
jgi:hypothetical protein